MNEMLVGLFIKSVLLTVVTLAMISLLRWFAARHVSAAVRHLICLFAFASLSLLPVLSFVLPIWRVVPITPANIIVNPTAVPTPTPRYGWLEKGQSFPKTPADWATPPTFPRSVQSQEQLALATVAPPPIVRDWTKPVLIAYAMVAFALLFRLALGHFGVWRIVHRAKLLEGRQFTGIAVRESDEVTVPLTVGVGRSAVVVLPTGFASVGLPERLEAVLAHETAHVRRGDYATQTCGDIVCALYFVNPLVWILGGVMRGEAERAADDHVLAGNAVRPSEYAAHLLETVRNLQGRRGIPGVAVTMAQRSEVSARIGAVLAANVSRVGQLSATGLVGMGLVCTAMAIGIARVGLASAKESSNRSTKVTVAPINPFRKTLKDGTVVELIWVTSPKAQSIGVPVNWQPEWKPDGEPFIESPEFASLRKRGYMNMATKLVKPYRFAISVRGTRTLGLQPVNLVQVEKGESVLFTYGSGKALHFYDVRMQDYSATRELNVRIARPDWHPLLAVTAFKTIIDGKHQELGGSNVTGIFQSNGEQFDTDLRMTHPVQTNKGTALTVTYKILKKGIVANASCRFIAETWQGKEITGQVRGISSNGSTITNKVLLADTPIARVKFFRVEACIQDRVTFSDIALQPRVRQSFQKTLEDGTTFEVLAIARHPWWNQSGGVRWWRPDGTPLKTTPPHASSPNDYILEDRTKQWFPPKAFGGERPDMYDIVARVTGPADASKRLLKWQQGTLDVYPGETLKWSPTFEHGWTASSSRQSHVGDQIVIDYDQFLAIKKGTRQTALTLRLSESLDRGGMPATQTVTIPDIALEPLPFSGERITKTVFRGFGEWQPSTTIPGVPPQGMDSIDSFRPDGHAIAFRWKTKAGDDVLEVWDTLQIRRERRIVLLKVDGSRQVIAIHAPAQLRNIPMENLYKEAWGKTPLYSGAPDLWMKSEIPIPKAMLPYIKETILETRPMYQMTATVGP